jgi:hypothetical protein
VDVTVGVSVGVGFSVFVGVVVAVGTRGRQRSVLVQVASVTTAQPPHVPSSGAEQ